MTLVLGPTLLCALWLNAMTRDALGQHHAWNMQIQGQTLAASIVSLSESGLAAATSRTLDVLNLDDRFAFVAVTDPLHQVIHRRTADAQAWASHQQWLRERIAQSEQSEADVALPVVLGRQGELIVHRIPMWNPPLFSHPGESAAATGRKLEGYLILALRDRRLPAMLGRIGAMQLTAAAVVCLLALPLVVFVVRRWTRPLEALLEATERIGDGETPPDVPAVTNDELGALAEGFNRMARKLHATRRQLETANHELEAKVARRTMELKQLNRKLETEVAQKSDVLHENQRLEQELRRTLAEVQVKNEQLEQAVDQLQAMAATDPLTGLANRRAFGRFIHRAFADARRQDQDIACVMIDLDGFKQLNDTLGHQKGDEVLIGVARALEAACRASDVPGRFGGDEFVLLLPGACEQSAAVVAQRVRSAFGEQIEQMLQEGAADISVTMSMGMATLGETRTSHPEQLIAIADEALYHAKSSGKNRLSIYRRNASHVVLPLAAAA